MTEIRKTFSDNEILNASIKGLCARCGLCCSVFNIDIPERVPTSVSEVVRSVVKKAGAVCPYFLYEGGLASCQCHDLKGCLSLRTCNGFSCEDPLADFEDDGYELSRSGYFDAVQACFDILLNDETVVDAVLDLCKRNVIQTSFYISCCRGVDVRGRVVSFLKRLLSYDYLIVEILDMIGDLHQWLKVYLQSLELDLAKPVHKAFMDRYVL